MTSKATTSGNPPLPEEDGVVASTRLGLTAAVLLAGSIGVWAATANLAEAVLASGTVVVEGNVKKVQHPTGGVVGEIRVRDGDRVNGGDLVVRLDETLSRASLLVITRQIDELILRAARLMAERDRTESFAIPDALATRAREPEIIAIESGERTLFLSRRNAKNGQKAQLRERITQLEQEINGLEGQHAAKLKEIELIAKELAGLDKLFAQNLVSTTKYTATQREAVRLRAEESQLISAQAQARGKIAEIELQIIQLDQDERASVIKELRETEARLAELNERRIAAADQLSRVDIRAPMTGIVHQLAVHTVGGVVAPTEPLMLIVPDTDALVVEARIAPQDIDQVRSADIAYVRFPAFNQRTTPEFTGTLTRLSADLTRDAQTAQSFYVARIALPEAEVKRMGELRLIPGMPAEIQIATKERTALSYLMKPLTDQFARAFKER
jgi:HlyD family secretion protein